MISVLDIETTFTNPFNINGVDYVLFEYQLGYEYEPSDISNVEFFENLVDSYLGGTAFTVGDNETEYALYQYQDDFEYDCSRFIRNFDTCYTKKI